MAILDWLKEAPLSAVYKERIASSEKQIASLEQENSSLKKENENLKSQLEQSEHQRRALEKQVVEIHDRNLVFDQKTGTWFGNDDLHYCAKCKAADAMSPLQATDRGWYCNVCQTPFYDPD